MKEWTDRWIEKHFVVSNACANLIYDKGDISVKYGKRNLCNGGIGLIGYP